MAKKGVIGVVVVLGVILYVLNSFSLKGSSCRDFNQGSVSINETVRIAVNFAVTSAEQAKGLSGCSSLEKGQGMYFPKLKKANAVFWMKGMVMPIDIIWIADGRVIGIEHNVPLPRDGDLIKYYALEKVDAVLEIGAGEAVNLGIVEGASVGAMLSGILKTR